MALVVWADWVAGEVGGWWRVTNELKMPDRKYINT